MIRPRRRPAVLLLHSHHRRVCWCGEFHDAPDAAFADLRDLLAGDPDLSGQLGAALGDAIAWHAVGMPEECGRCADGRPCPDHARGAVACADYAALAARLGLPLYADSEPAADAAVLAELRAALSTAPAVLADLKHTGPVLIRCDRMHAEGAISAKWTAVRGSDAPAGQYLTEYDPDGEGGAGAVTWSVHWLDALVFPGTAAAAAMWGRRSKVNPSHADGRPNRPLADAFSIRIVPAGTRPPRDIPVKGLR